MENGHGVNADIIRTTNTGITEFLGRSSADINEISTFFSSGNLHYNHIICIIRILEGIDYFMLYFIFVTYIITQNVWRLFISALYYDITTADQLLKEVTMMFS